MSLNRQQIGILIIESIAMLYDMLDLIEEMYISGDSDFTFGDYTTYKLSIESNLYKLLNKK